ncbi:MAG: hypothetical protein IT341_06850 [Chloroflexi bacterium]|nr:hypothetical protein [Chloroflexota bacterium]
MARPFPVYPPQLAFLGVIDRTSLLRRAWSDQELPPVYFGVGTIDDALSEADAVGVTAVWFRGRVWTHDGGNGWSTAMRAVERSVPTRQMALGV